jgi:FKBP-type peptidyl-prolyl cis-trans isomerase SlyD
MKIEDNRVVRFHYTVSEAGQGQIESSRELEAVSVLIGHGNLIAGLEDAMKGHEIGDRFETTLAPEQAYGPRVEAMVQRVPRKHFKGAKLAPGVRVTLPTDQGPRAMTVKKVGISVVDVDLNHPMAGKTLAFDVEIVDVREASAEEIAHKHAHGDGGHAHDVHEGNDEAGAADLDQ